MSSKIITALALASMMFATSCSSDEVTPPTSSEETTVTFTAQLPEVIGSRAETSNYFGDGKKASRLQYAVYRIDDENGTETWTHIPSLDGETTISTTLGTADVTLKFAKMINYKVVFWASAPNSPYTFVSENICISLTDNDIESKANDDTYDAFYAVENVSILPGSNTNENVTLKRPFAQLNIGTQDFDDYQTLSGKTITNVEIKLPSYSIFSFKTENFESPLEGLYFEGTIPTDKTFPGSASDAKYLTMNYIPVDKDGENIHVSLNIEDVTLEFDAVPIKPNYRTNLYGYLLTSSEDFRIELKSDFKSVENIRY